MEATAQKLGNCNFDRRCFVALMPVDIDRRRRVVCAAIGYGRVRILDPFPVRPIRTTVNVISGDIARRRGLPTQVYHMVCTRLDDDLVSRLRSTSTTGRDLPGANLDNGDPETLLFSMMRFLKFLPARQKQSFLAAIAEKVADHSTQAGSLAPGSSFLRGAATPGTSTRWLALSVLRRHGQPRGSPPTVSQSPRIRQ